jgi:DNA-binding transcriptional ArsR family regulator
MKRNMDIVRSLLLRLEELPIRADGIILIHGSDPEIAVDGYSADELDYHLKLLKEQGLIDSPRLYASSGRHPVQKANLGRTRFRRCGA